MPRERARGEKGKFKPDDPSTPDINEAYVAPKKSKGATVGRKSNEQKEKEAAGQNNNSAIAAAVEKELASNGIFRMDQLPEGEFAKIWAKYKKKLG